MYRMINKAQEYIDALFKRLSRLRTMLADWQHLWCTLLPYRVILPFCFGYMLSYFSRNITAILADDFSMEFAINANSLGLLTSAYFLAFAMCQIPLGVLLDRFTPARVEGVFLFFAMGGACLTASAWDPWMLSVGRLMMGFGVSACLMAAYRGIFEWFPPEKIPLLNAFVLTSGGLGAMVSGWPPTASFVSAFGWRNIFWILALSFAVASILLWLVVPKSQRSSDAAHESIFDMLVGFLTILRHGQFWLLMPMAATTQGLMLAINGLWVVPWMMRVEAYTLEQTSFLVVFIALAMVIGQLVSGWLASYVFQGSPRMLYRLVLFGCIIANMALLFISLRTGMSNSMLWFVFALSAPFAMLAYPLLTQIFDHHLAGRVITLLNFIVFFMAFVFQWAIGAVIGSIDAQLANIDIMRFQMGFGVPATLAMLSILVTLIARAIYNDHRGMGI